MPVEEGYVNVTIEGQEVELLVDSNAWGIKLIDGRWYEAKYGKGACDEPHAGCYFCKEESPCVFKKKLVRKSSFDDGKWIEGIERTGSLELGGHETSNFTFTVFRIIEWVGSRPHGFFGLAGLPRTSNLFQPWPGQEGLLDALVRHNVIGRQSYTVRTDTTQVSEYVTGQLTLGGTVERSKSTKYTFPQFTYDPRFYRARTSVWVSSLKLFDPRGNLTTKERPVGLHSSSFSTTMDTGANGVYLPYEGLLEDIERELKKEMKGKGYREKQIGEVWRRDEWGVVYVKEEAFDSLPVLGFQLGEGDYSIPIKIHPMHYCADTLEGEYLIFVQQTNHSVLGTPFFRAYSVHVDYTSKKIALLEN
ncbi:hypothetical protein FOZ63_030499 [Perkinsus olseni]|uniref:Peptidase A1 domain-containing protein n=1 Tax=Perkinsus olseni TaxID=32597 RepID=A0A7J6PIP0_PEROL|nr:hypothetical protein FOZ60_003402 [Perkinsus olseni]KAF4713682.1 hypothetical protein FOZ62_023140 [Perkinsus olseni]KAF4726795.1 hypothetical protein FOZ63_030499 [Perkinsus olseni]